MDRFWKKIVTLKDMAFGFSGFFNKLFFSVGGKILMLACGIALFSTALVSGMYYKQVTQLLIEKEISKLQDRVKMLSPMLQEFSDDPSHQTAALEKIFLQVKDIEELYITDNAGAYLVHPDSERRTAYTITGDFPEMQSFFQEDTQDKTFIFKRDNDEFVLHAMKIYSDPMDQKDFLVLALKTSKRALLVQITRINANSLFLLIVSLVLASVVAVLLARFLTEPLQHTINEIRAYEKGKARLDLPTERRDEIGELAGAFQDLIENLDHSRKIEQETLARLQAVLDNTVDGLITIDERGTIQSYNKACEKIFGYLPAEVTGKNVKMLMPERYSSQHDGYLQNYHRTGEAKVIGVGREVEAQHKNGTVFPIELSVAQINIKGRRIYSGIVRDITERKKAEEEVMRSNLELERFAYVASHDLQEPLRMVANFTNLLEEEYKDQFDEQGKQYMGFIIDATRRMQAMINDLLEYSRIGHDDAGFAESDCNALAKTAMDNLNESIRETRAKVTIGELPTLFINSTRFTGLLQNLIGNAIKYRDKSRDPEIKISAIPRDGEWLFSVADNGIGIKQEYLKQIFIIFKRLHGKGEYQGTGIGLAICKKVVESFGGKIWAESEPGKGTVIYFTIPKRIKMKEAA